KGKKDCVRADLDRVVNLASELRSNGTHGKAIFACASRKFWREFDLPPQLGMTQVKVDRHFHLRPLSQLLSANPRLAVALVDRHRARLFELRMGELRELEGISHPLSQRGHSEGYAGFEGGHAQRRVEDEALHHYRNVAEALKRSLENKV